MVSICLDTTSNAELRCANKISSAQPAVKLGSAFRKVLGILTCVIWLYLFLHTLYHTTHDSKALRTFLVESHVDISENESNQSSLGQSVLLSSSKSSARVSKAPSMNQFSNSSSHGFVSTTVAKDVEDTITAPEGRRSNLSQSPDNNRLGMWASSSARPKTSLRGSSVGDRHVMGNKTRSSMEVGIFSPATSSTRNFTVSSMNQTSNVSSYGFVPTWAAKDVVSTIESTWRGRELAKLKSKFREAIESPLHSMLPVPGDTDGRYFVHAGDLVDMWLRDTSAVLHPWLLPLWQMEGSAAAAPVSASPALLRVLEGAAITMANLFVADPNCPIWEAHAPLLPAKCPQRLWSGRQTGFELDQPLYLVRLLWYLHRVSKGQSHVDKSEPIAVLFSKHVKEFAAKLIEVLRSKVGRSGLIATSDRPSDDPVVYQYNIPDNLFAASMLEHFRDLAVEAWNNPQLSVEATALATGIREGLHAHGVGDRPGWGRVYCYETNAAGKCLYQDDANLPSLLAIPYMDDGRMVYDAAIYERTRRSMLSPIGNNHFFTGRFASGVGSEGSRSGQRVWVLGLLAQGLTAGSATEAASVLQTILRTDGSRYGLHEAFDPDNPRQYSREWFDWPNALFAEFVLRCCINLVNITGPEMALPPNVAQVREDMFTGSARYGKGINSNSTGSWRICAFKNGVCEWPQERTDRTLTSYVCVRHGTGWNGGKWSVRRKYYKDFPVSCSSQTLGNPARGLPKSCWINDDPAAC